MNFYENTLEEISTYLLSTGVEKFRANQIFKWVYNKGIRDFQAMTDIPKKLRSFFQAHFSFDLPFLEKVFHSKDGSVKFLFKTGDGEFFEALFIPEEKRRTLCLSTQIGCKMGCRFCSTAKIPFKRNLSTSEIVGQVIRAKEYLKDQITNIVFMGMGEPLDNFENLKKAIKILKDANGLNLSWRKITISTVGLIDKLKEMDERVNVAISLNAPTDEKRSMLMPANKLYDIKRIIEFAKEYTSQKGERITFEYVLIAGINDSLEDARLLKNLLSGIKCKINLIPYNESPFFDFKKPSKETIEKFQAYLLKHYFTAIIRQERGVDIYGGCGQLGISLLLRKDQNF